METRIIATYTCLFLASAFCMADNSSTTERSGSVFQAGPGVLISNKAQKGADTKILPIPAVYYQQGRLILFGPQANWVLHYDDGLMVSALGKLRYEGYRSSESRYLRGMSNRRATLEGGLSLAQDFDWARLTAEWTSDILNEHKGHEFRVLASRQFPDVLGIERLTVTPSVGGNWRSKQLNDYYYGVRYKEARPTRPAYTVGDTLGLLTSLRVDYRIAERWTMFGAASVEWLRSEVTDSPIVDQHHRLGVLFGALYTF